ncbi:MAG TPA: aminotransferase class III-fold pyridoxal phosphate-dependent enzyme [Myxococcales bacterium]|nr:aminotransferase class III-fold pyridoxal phosphate-dependent enzyme [Myxococcales bacterium]
MNISQDMTKLDLQSLWHPLRQHRGIAADLPRQIVSAEGVYLVDVDGARLLDAVAGIWCVNVGYGREEIADVAREQMARLPYLPATFTHASAAELAGELTRMLGYESKVFFTNSGSEANEAAFKVARQYHAQTGSPGRYKIIARYRGYHGNTLGALSATGQAERKMGYGPFAPGFVHIDAPDPYRINHDCADQLERAIEREGASTVAAFIMEPVIAGGGVLVPPDGYLPRVREICDRHGVLLIVDEVVTGFGRTGISFAHKRASIEPDLLTLGKGIASGYQPLAAMVAKQHVFDAFDGEPGDLRHFRHINTYGAHPVATAVGLCNLEILQRENLFDRAAKVGDALLTRLQRLEEHPNVGEVRGRGLLIGLELVENKESQAPLTADRSAKVVARCARDGVLVGRTANTTPGMDNVIMLAPPYVISEAETDIVAKTLENAIREEL